MKLIILFLLFSFSAFGNYAKLLEVETNSISKVFMRSNSCGVDCIKIPFGYDSNYHRVVDEMVNDVDSPINSKSEIESCLGESDCSDKLALKICTDTEEIKYIDAGYTEIYCSKITSYAQILSGQKIVVEDIGLKTAYLAVEQSKKDAKIAEKNSILLLKQKLIDGLILTPVELSSVLKYLIK